MANAARRIVIGMAIGLVATPLIAETTPLPGASGPSLAPEKPGGDSSKPTARRPVSDFAALPFMVGPKLSPDGRRVAARIAVAGKQVLTIVDLFDKSAQPGYVDVGEVQLTSWSWVNDEWLAASLGVVKPFANEQFYVTRVAGVRADGKKIVPLNFETGGQGSHMIWRARDGTPRVLLSSQQSVYKDDAFWPVIEEVDVSTGRRKLVQRSIEGVMSWYADPAGVVRLGVGRTDDGRNMRLYYRGSASDQLRVIDKARSSDDGGLISPILTTASTGSAMTLSSTSGYAAIHELDLKTLTVGKKLYGVDGHDIDDYDLTPSGDAIAAVEYTSDRPRTQWQVPALAEVQSLFDKAVGSRAATIVSTSRDQTKMFVQVGDASTPGSYYYYDAAAGGAMKRVAFVSETLKGDTLGPVSTYRYKARDGQSIEAVLTLPKGRTAKGLPLILLPHGGPEARDSAEYDWWSQFLADRGYAVLQPNYRGSSGYGQAFLKAGEGQWGLKMQDDLNDAVDDLAAKGTIDARRVCIAGASYGGYAAMRGAQRDGARYRCAISYAGVADLNAILRYDSGFLFGAAARDSWREIAPDLKAVSPSEHASEFSTPILILHGKKDLRVPVAQSRKMAERLKAAGKPVEYVEQPLGDHGFTRQADRQEFLERMESFLDKHNPA